MNRATAPVVGVLVLIGVTLTVGAALGVVVSADPTEPAPMVSFDVTAAAETDEIRISHQRGDELDLDTVQIEISIDGEPLEHQPPVPFFAAEGFQGGPTGPFNAASADQWRAGETGGVQLAETNSPQLSAGETVRVQIQTETATIADISTEAR